MRKFWSQPYGTKTFFDAPALCLVHLEALNLTSHALYHLKMSIVATISDQLTSPFYFRRLFRSIIVNSKETEGFNMSRDTISIHFVNAALTGVKRLGMDV